MKNNFWRVLISILAVVLGLTLIVSLAPSVKEDLPDKEEDSTDSSAGGESYDPSLSKLSFPTSDTITTAFMNAAKNAAWTHDDSGWVYSEGSTGRVALPDTFVLPTDEKLLFRFSDGIAPRLMGNFWNVQNGSVEYDLFSTYDTGETIFTFKNPNSTQCTVQDLKDNLFIYTCSDIQANLQQKNLSNEHLNQLLDLLVCGGCYIESSVDTLMYWDSDSYVHADTAGFFGNRICMRYAVSVPHDVRVKVADGYECIVYMFESLDSKACAYTYGWGKDSLYMTVPADAPFVVAIRAENNDTVTVEDWRDIVTFELAK